MKKTVWVYLTAILTAIGLAVLIRVFVGEAYRIPTRVMQPTLEAGDLIFVLKWPFRVAGRDAEYGEVVTYDQRVKQNQEITFIKRVVAMAGETIAVRKGRLILNGKLLDFEPAGSEVCGFELHPKGKYQICLEPPLMDDYGPETVPRESTFVIGDLRTKEVSKSDHHMVAHSAILSLALWVWLSVDPNASGSSDGFLARLRMGRMFNRIK